MKETIIAISILQIVSWWHHVFLLSHGDFVPQECYEPCTAAPGQGRQERTEAGSAPGAGSASEGAVCASSPAAGCATCPSPWDIQGKSPQYPPPQKDVTSVCSPVDPKNFSPSTLHCVDGSNLSNVTVTEKRQTELR